MSFDSNNSETKIFGKTVAEIDADYNRNIDDLVDEFLQQNATATSSYKGVSFDEKAKYKDNTSDEKELFTYDKSDERIKTKNPTARHTRPQEVFSLIIDCLENRISDEKLKKVKEDMFKSYGEWLSCAFEKQGDKLIVYLDPTGLVWNGSEYVKTENFACSAKKEFNIPEVKSQTWTSINKLPDDWVEYIYTRKFADLPKDVQEKAQTYLPPSGKIWPVGRGVCGYGVVGYGYGLGASRGVVVNAGQKFLHPKWRLCN